MRSVAVTIGADNVSNDLIQFETMMCTLSVGKCTIIIRNTDGEWTGDFAEKDNIVIQIADDNDASAQTIFKGYLSQAIPYYGLNHEQFVLVAGKDRAAPLDWRMYEKKYVDTQADDILDDLFDGVSELPEITYNNAGVNTTAIDYEARLGTYYSQILREIGQQIDYDGYVSTSDTLQFFPVGSISSGVTLADTSNILSLRYTENDDINIRNNIQIEGSQIFDGYSEKNASAYDASGTNTVITDEGTVIAVGDWSVKGVCGADNTCQIRLDLSGYFDGDGDHVWDRIDVSTESRTLAWFARTDAAPADQFIDLEDTNGDHIHWYSDTICDLPAADTWYYNELPIGSDQRIVPFIIPGAHDQWEYDTIGGDTFNWIIQKIEFEQIDAVNGDIYYLDGIGLPLNLLCTKTNAGSIASYATRKLYLRRPDIRTQNELDDYTAYLLAKRAGPQSMIEVDVVGNTSLDYPGETVTVTSANEGLSAQACRIVELHHIYSALSPVTYGRDYITRLILDAQTSMVSDTQLFEYALSPQLANAQVALEYAKSVGREYKRANV